MMTRCQEVSIGFPLRLDTLSKLGKVACEKFVGLRVRSKRFCAERAPKRTVIGPSASIHRNNISIGVSPAKVCAVAHTGDNCSSVEAILLQ